MATKVDAARIATAAGIPVVLTDAERAKQAIFGEPIGTYFHAAPVRRPTRLLWLEHATSIRGSVTVDDGAVQALRKRGKSLLAAGIVAVSGDFTAGDPIDICDEAGIIVARGLVNFDHADVEAMRGRSTADIAADLGEEFGRECVHRDDMVLLRGVHV